MKAKPKSTSNKSLDSLLHHLQIEHVPTKMAGRENQITRIQQDVTSSISRNGGEGHILYLYGQPGTGKTATVRHVWSKLNENKFGHHIVHYHEINALALTSPGNLFVALYKTIQNAENTLRKSASNIAACFDALEHRFRSTRPPKHHHIIVIDEFDNLMALRPGKETKAFHDRLYSLFDWPASQGAGLTLICIANTLCLPEVLLPRCFSRLGFGHINFPTYPAEELIKIVQDRFDGVKVPVEKYMDPIAMQLLCRKVAALSGDVRLVLSLCHRLVKKAVERRKPINPSEVTIETKSLFHSSTADYAEELSTHTMILLFSIILRFLNQRSPDKTLGFAVKIQDVRASYGEILTRMAENSPHPEAWLLDIETLLMEGLDELCEAGVLQWAYHLPVRITSGEPRSRARTGRKPVDRVVCDPQCLQRWGQCAVTLMLSPAELVTGMCNSGRMSAPELQSGMDLLRDQLSVS